MKLSKNLLTILLTVVLFIPFTSCKKEQKQEEIKPIENIKEIKFGIRADLTPEDMNRIYGPFFQYMSQKIGIPVKFIAAKGYSELENMMKKEEIMVAKFSPLSYVLFIDSVDKNKYEMLARQLPYGYDFYFGYIIVRKDSGINNIKDLKGKKFAFVSKKSTSGFLYPMEIFIKNNINIKTFFKSFSFEGSHLNVLKAVYSKNADGGACFDGAYRRFKHKDELKIIYKTSGIPDDCVIANKKLPKEIREKIKKILLSYDTIPEKYTKLVKEKEEIYGFTEGSDKDYEVLRKVYKELKTKYPELMK